ncbi:hypothetical protein UlMin_002599 [Ulmus minor]
MDPKLTEVSQLFERFKAAVVRKYFDTSTKLLSQLKVLLTEFRSLPPLFEDTPNAIHELTLATNILYLIRILPFPFASSVFWDIYEHAVVLSVRVEDQDAFERDFYQLKPYYTDARDRLPQSSEEYPILGLNLLRVLVQNRVAEFHTELELLSPATLEHKWAYNRVLSARQRVPHETYHYFMDLLAKTVRDEIAGCSEKAYDFLSINDAQTDEHPEWEIKDNKFVIFQKAKESAPCKEIPLLQLINQTLSY